MRDSLIKLMPWMGGKGQLMWAIQMLLPIHYKTLVDVFGGSGIITLNTAVPKGCLQIYNDLNHDLYNLLFCVKHRPTVRWAVWLRPCPQDTARAFLNLVHTIQIHTIDNAEEGHW